MITIGLALIIALLLLSNPFQGTGVSVSDKLAHLVAFGALAVPLSSVRARFAPFVFISISAYGGGIELIQPLVGRAAEWADFGMDVLGAAIGAALGAAIARIRRGRDLV